MACSGVDVIGAEQGLLFLFREREAFDVLARSCWMNESIDVDGVEWCAIVLLRSGGTAEDGR